MPTSSLIRKIGFQNGICGFPIAKTVITVSWAKSPHHKVCHAKKHHYWIRHIQRQNRLQFRNPQQSNPHHHQQRPTRLSNLARPFAARRLPQYPRLLRSHQHLLARYSPLPAQPRHHNKRCQSRQHQSLWQTQAKTHQDRQTRCQAHS